MALRDILDANFARSSQKEEEEMTLVDYDMNSTSHEITHPDHYNTGRYETIDVIEDWGLDFHCGNALKYISRHKYKNDPRGDIEKAIWYLQRYMETI
mgnify:CR=1 FL=1